MIQQRRTIAFMLYLSFLLLLDSAKVVFGFAAKKKGGGNKKKGGTARTNKGFGAPPPTLEEVLSKFRTRIPDVTDGINNSDNHLCPCDSGKTYGECCGPLHRNERLCLTMTDVLRSRYSAFSWRNIKYVMDTTHESCRDYREDKIAWANDLNKGGMFDSFDFVKLDAGEEEPSNENEGFIEFKVTLRARENTATLAGGANLPGQETVITERSRFVRDSNTGSWSYASGDVRSDVAGLEDTTLN